MVLESIKQLNVSEVISSAIIGLVGEKMDTTTNRDKISVDINEDVIINMIDPKLNKMNIRIILWKNIVNIYIGSELVHFGDDIFVNNASDALELTKNLETLMSKKIKETLSKDSQHYSFNAIDGSWKWDVNLKKNTKREYKEYIYDPWW